MNSPINKLHSDILTRLLDVSKQLSATLELDALFQLIIEVGSELTNSESCSILLHDSRTNSLEFVAGPGLQKEKLKTIRVPIEGSIAGLVYQNGTTISVKDAQNNPNLYQGVDKSINFTTKNILAVPMVIKTKTIGILEAVNKIDEKSFTQEDQITLSILASHAAIAINNTNLLAELKRANKELQALDRLKSNFIAIASHELRTPLGIVLGHAAFLKETITEAEGRSQVETILQYGERLKSIIEDLGTIDTYQSGKSRIRETTINLYDLLSKVVREYHELAAKKLIRVHLNLPRDEFYISGDNEKLTVAFGNILKNALTYTSDKGKVLINANRRGDFIEVSIIDNGIGIPNSDLEKIFDRFYQVESHLTRRYGGMGLGLSIAKDMIMLHNGKIWAESVEGKGSKFSVLLPMKVNETSAFILDEQS